MPAYDSESESKPILGGGPVVVWDAEQPMNSSPLETASQAVSLSRNAHLPNCFSVELEFDGAPGAFGVDVQTADTDEEKYYVTKSSITAVTATNNVARVEVLNVVARFARLKMSSCANDVDATARFF